jgi:hypothetical protein
MSYGAPVTAPLRPAVLFAVSTASLAVGALVMGMVGAVIGLSGQQTDAAIALRGLLPLAFILLATRVLGAWGVRRDVPNALAVVVSGAVLAYLLDPFTWNARTGITQLVTEPGVVTLVVDLVLWLVVAVAGARWGVSRAPVPASSRPPYG